MPAPPSYRAGSPVTRREFLARAGAGFGSVALTWMLHRDAAAARPEVPRVDATAPLACRPPHFGSRAKSVIWLFMEGGPSHLDLFDPKPVLDQWAGRPMPESFGRPITAMGTAGNTLMGTRRRWARHGRSGLWVSDWYPHVARHADDLCVVRSCQADGLNHVGSV
ncbi:MAG: DUF1501 domain-containing protein, partial [Verrucomicrobiales bacterium]|nr:DUF1501 domain-containing protein [Verrucomicrobiales bacterium]